MSDDSRNVPTRRTLLKLGGTAIGGGVLAGCVSGGGGSSDGDESPDGTDSTSDESYTVSMAPMGEIEFESVPSSFLAYYPISAGTAVALGHGDGVNGIGYDKQLFGETVDYYYDSLDGVSFDWEDLGRVTPSDNPNALDKELFYELDSDVHFLDPCLLRSAAFGWSEDEIETLSNDLGPFFGNYYSRDHGQPPAGCRDGYQYHTLWEYVEKMAAVLQEEERFRALESIKNDVVGRIEADLPPESERPTVAVVAYTDGTFWPYDFRQSGYLWAHVRPMGVRNAFETTEGGPGDDGAYDYEGLVAAEPDVMLRYWGCALGQSFVDNRETVLDDPLADDVPALRNGRYYPSGHGMQGPVMHLFQLEMTAKQLYPDVFGEWPEYDPDRPYPEIPEEEQLFDREEVAAIVNGEF